MEILDMKVKNYEFTCLIPALELNQSDRNYLGLGNCEDDEWISIEGTFSVEWDDDIPLIIVDDAYAVNGSKSVKLVDDSAMLFEQEIYDSVDHLELASDRQASLADATYANYKDSLYE